MFDVMDKNGDGEIDKAEAAAAMKRLESGLNQRMAEQAAEK